MRKTTWLLWALALQVLLPPASAVSAPLAGCCLQASGWASPSLGAASCVAVDKTLKRVYAVDNGNGVIKAFHYDGTVDSSFGGGSGQAPMSAVFGVAVGPCDHPGVYGVTRGIAPSVVTKFDQDGNPVWTSQPLPDGAAFGICVDDQGNSYVVSGYNAIYVLDPDGVQKNPVTGTGNWALNLPVGVFMKGLQLYVSDNGNDRIVQFTETGVNSYSFTPTQAVTVAPLQPYGLTQGLDGNFYVAFHNSSGYQVYDGQFNPIAPFCTQAALLGAFGVDLDETGAVYVADNSGLATVVKMQACFDQPAFNPCYLGKNPPASGQDFIFPSPARGDHASFSFKMAETGSMDFKVWNSNGELVTEIQDHKPAGVQVTSFSLSGFTPGVYFYGGILKYDSGRTETLKPKPFAFVK